MRIRRAGQPAGVCEHQDSAQNLDPYQYTNPILCDDGPEAEQVRIAGWDLGHGVGVSYLLGVYPKLSSPVANQSTTINQRVGLSYTANGYNLSANIIYGSESDTHTVPDYLNADLTATTSYGKWSYGPVGYACTDTSSPFASYKRQSQIAVGGLVGYSFPGVILQTYLTHVVEQSGYHGNDTRLWVCLTIPMT